MHCKFDLAELSKFTRATSASMREYKQYSRMLIDVQRLLERSAPSFKTYRPWMASLTTSTLPEHYKKELLAYKEKPFLGLEELKIHEGMDLRIPVSGKPQTFRVRKLFVDDPTTGCVGIVLETKRELFVVFRSATHTSTFVKIGASSMMQSPKNLAPHVQCNAYLGHYYDRHFSDGLAAIAQARPRKAMVFLGYSMGAALAQLAMYDLYIQRGMSLQQQHLFFASPRIASASFYTELSDRGIHIRNIIAATRLENSVYLDPVPLLAGFSDPPILYLVGQLFEPDVSWHDAVLPVAGTALNVIETSDAFRDHFHCHAVSILGSYLQTAFGQSSMDLHSAYSALVYHCSI